MASPFCEKAIEEALRHGVALLKFISANDVGKTGSHQCGYYLPKQVWRFYTPQPPQKGINNDHLVTIDWWQIGRTTQSCVKWYGTGTRSEYRVTRFGRDFPFLADDSVGDLLILVPRSISDFAGFVLTEEDEFESIQAQLGIDIVRTWGLFTGEPEPTKTADQRVDKTLRQFAEGVSQFPTTLELSTATQRILTEGVPLFDHLEADAALVLLLETEYALFKLIERQLCTPEIVRPFRSIDEFLKAANSILQRRKSRAGKSVEHHCHYLLARAGIVHEMQPAIDGEPDIIVPSKAAYDDPSFPESDLFVVGVKRTCKDRWRQVTKEGARLQKKYLITIQNGISASQLQQMTDAGVTLVVPKALHKAYPAEHRGRLLTFASFIELVREREGRNGQYTSLLMQSGPADGGGRQRVPGVVTR